MNKISVREEINRLRQYFEQLCSSGKVSPEIRVVMNSLLVIVELILSVFLEKKTRKNSKNSSLPPSQTQKDETAKTSSASKGRGKKVFGEISNTRTKETVTVAIVTTCGEFREFRGQYAYPMKKAVQLHILSPEFPKAS